MIKEKERCRRCGRIHKRDKCTLKKPCNICKELHLTILHDVNSNKSATVMFTSSPLELLYMDKLNRSHKVILKVVSVNLHHGERTLKTYAILDDGADRSNPLHQAVQCLGLTTQPEIISLRTVRQDVIQLNGASVSFEFSPINQTAERYVINGAFTAHNLGLSQHTHPDLLPSQRCPITAYQSCMLSCPYWFRLCSSYHSHKANTRGATWRSVGSTYQARMGSPRPSQLNPHPAQSLLRSYLLQK